MTSGLPFFRQHQIRRDLDRRLRQRRRRSAEPPREIYSVRSAEDIEIESIVDPENLLLAYDKLKREGGQSPGLDGLTYDDFSRREIAAVLRQVAQAIRAGQYRPHPTRLVRIPKGDGRYRELRLATVVDRTVAKAVAEALTPALDGVLLPGVMGFRRGISVWMMLLTIIRMIGEGYCVIAQDDIRDAFPAVRIDLALVAYRQHLHDDDLLRLVETILRGHDGEQHTVGLDQGSPLSPITLNVFLNHFLDRPYSADPDLPFWLRYVDNVVYLCRNVSEGRRALQRARELLSQVGMTFKGQTGRPVNLQRRRPSGTPGHSTDDGRGPEQSQPRPRRLERTGPTIGASAHSASPSGPGQGDCSGLADGICAGFRERGCARGFATGTPGSRPGWIPGTCQ